MSYLAEMETDAALAPLQSAACTYRIALGRWAGQKVLTLNNAGQVVLMLKTPYRDGTTHIVMSPLEFMQRLAALVPRPRLNLIRFHGVLASNNRSKDT